MIRVTVNNRGVQAIPLSPVTVGSEGIVCAFLFSDDWAGLAKTAIFRGSGEEEEYIILNNQCVVPAEVLTEAGGMLEVGVYGNDGHGTTIRPTIWGVVGRIEDGAISEDAGQTGTTPSWAAQLQVAVQDVLTSEAARVAAEDAREDAEEDRVDAEEARVTAETARAAAETARASAETSRASAETARASAETARASAETSRASAESARATAETARASAEEERAAAEAIREENYATYVETVSEYAGAASAAASRASGAANQANSARSSAASSASQASASASQAANSASQASTSASTASNAATTATTKAGEASTSATAAGNAQTAAEAAQTAAEAAAALLQPAATSADVGKALIVKTVSGGKATAYEYGDVGGGAVEDVQINGTSIVNDGVAEIPIASGDTLGIVKIASDGSNGIGRWSSGNIYVNSATVAQIKTGTEGYRPIVPGKQNASVFYGLAKAAGDDTQSASSNPVGTYTDGAKAAIKDMIGATAGGIGFDDSVTYPAGSLGAEVSDQKNAISQKQDAPSSAGTAGQVLGLDSNLNPAWVDQTGGGGGGMNIVTLTGTQITQVGADNTMYMCGELTELTFTVPSVGITGIRFTSGTTPTVLTISGVTAWMFDFDPTTLEASTTYEINVLNGIGVAGWA